MSEKGGVCPKSCGRGASALTRERIVAVASDLIERDGLGAFTMRSLGRELGVSAMAVYSHFDSGMPFLWPSFSVSWRPWIPIRCPERLGTTRCDAP